MQLMIKAHREKEWVRMSQQIFITQRKKEGESVSHEKKHQYEK